MNQKGFFASLLDLSFEQCLTVKMIKVLYIIAMGGSAITGLVVLVAGISAGGMASIFFGLIGGGIVAIVSLIASRLWLELVIVIFRIADHTGEMAKNTPSESMTASPAQSL